MPETLSIHLPDFVGTATLNLFLRRPDTGALVNTGGDALTESPGSSGRFTATLTEARIGLGTLAAAVYDGSELPDNLIWDGWLEELRSICTDTYGPAAGGGSDVWSVAEKNYAIAQLAYLTLSGNAVVVTSGVFMCGRGDLEQIFGTVAIARWADLDGYGDSDPIATRINYRIAMADNYIRATLGNSYWTMPVQGGTVPAILVYNVAVLAGVYLYEGRGVQDYNAAGYAQHQLSFHKANVDNFIKGVLLGSISLSPLARGQLMTAPETVNAF